MFFLELIMLLACCTCAKTCGDRSQVTAPSCAPTWDTDDVVLLQQSGSVHRWAQRRIGTAKPVALRELPSLEEDIFDLLQHGVATTHRTNASSASTREPDADLLQHGVNTSANTSARALSDSGDDTESVAPSLQREDALRHRLAGTDSADDSVSNPQELPLPRSSSNEEPSRQPTASLALVRLSAQTAKLGRLPGITFVFIFMFTMLLLACAIFGGQAPADRNTCSASNHDALAPIIFHDGQSKAFVPPGFRAAPLAPAWQPPSVFTRGRGGDYAPLFRQQAPPETVRVILPEQAAPFASSPLHGAHRPL